MLKQVCRSESYRFNISENKGVVDLTENILPTMEDIIQRGLRFVSDKVEFKFHGSEVFVLSQDNLNAPVHFTNYLPIDKNLSVSEIEDINLYLCGLYAYEDTALCKMAVILANVILREINKNLKNYSNKVVVHFAPANDESHLEQTAKLGYAFMVNSTLQMETSFFVEVIND